MLDDEVHVWYAHLDLPAAALRPLYETLAPDEQSKAAHFKFRVDGLRFIARHGILRSVLAKYLSISPAEVELLSSGQGKLCIAANQSSRIRFSLSHSGDLAIYAVAMDREVGVDIERIDHSIAWWEIAKAFFSPCEQDAISRRHLTVQAETFFEIWTRKESILKALGMGLQFDPARINVAVDYAPGRPALVRYDDCLWKLLALSTNGFAATLTAAGANWRVQRHQCSLVAPRRTMDWCRAVPIL